MIIGAVYQFDVRGYPFFSVRHKRSPILEMSGQIKFVGLFQTPDQADFDKLIQRAEAHNAAVIENHFGRVLPFLKP